MVHNARRDMRYSNLGLKPKRIRRPITVLTGAWCYCAHEHALSIILMHVFMLISARFSQAALNIAKQPMPVPYLPPSTQWATTGARTSGCRAFSCTLGPPSPYRTPLDHDDSAVAVVVVFSVSTLVLIVARLRGKAASGSPQNCLLAPIS